MSEPLLAVEHLTTGFDINGRFVPAVNDVSFHVHRGETLCIVGESGSGKSLTARSIIRLVPPPGRIASGRILLAGRDLMTASERELQRIRGARIALIFQEPATALNPVFTIGSQIAETLAVHGRATGAAAWKRAIELLASVGFPEPEKRIRDYPHQLSGGLRQRALIAMSLACEPEVVIADEPTTALDATLQAQILELLRDLKERMGLALILITHDLDIVAQMGDRVAVMNAGTIVEQSAVSDLFRSPQHPYTRQLIAAMPKDVAPKRPSATPLLDVRGLVKEFARRPGFFRKPSIVRVVDGVSFHVDEGETFGLVGESGSGKTTTGRCILRLTEATSGEVLFKGENVLAFAPARMRAARREMQIVFQDPYSSLNPRMRVGDIVEEPLIIHRIGTKTSRRARVEELFALVGLDPAHTRRYPREFSGGQRQRIGLARALALNPSLIIADEAVSALDVSVQAQVIDLLMDLQARLKLTYLFIAHDLRLVRQICTRVAVMYRGKIVEMGPTEQLFTAPSHPYTRALLEAIPTREPRQIPGARPFPPDHLESR